MNSTQKNNIIAVLLGFFVWGILAVRNPDGWDFWLLVLVVLGGFVFFTIQPKKTPHKILTYSIGFIILIAYGLWTHQAILIVLGLLISWYIIAATQATTMKGLYEFLLVGPSLLLLTAAYQSSLIGPWPNFYLLAIVVIPVLLYLSLFIRIHSLNQISQASISSSTFPVFITLFFSFLLGGSVALMRHFITDNSNPLQKTTPSYKVVAEATFGEQSVEDPYWRHDLYSGVYAYSIEGYQWLDILYLPQKITNFPSVILNSMRLEQDQNRYIYHYSVLGKGYNKLSLDGSFSVSVLSHKRNGVYVLHAQAQEGVVRKELDFPSETNQLYLSAFSGNEEDLLLKSKEQVLAARDFNIIAPKTYALVQSWKNQGLNDDKIILEIHKYFYKNLRYNYDYQSLDPKKNKLDYFLFTEKRGVCRHFANAFALMTRMAGIPSRIITGWHGGAYDPLNKKWTIRERDAHAWTEIYINGGWKRVDPTGFAPVEKGIPENEWLEKITSKTDFVFSDEAPKKFSTQGSADNKKKISISQTIPPKIFLGGLVVFILLWFVFKKTSPEKEWQKTVKKVPEFSFKGPMDCGEAILQDLPLYKKEEWTTLVNRYILWRYNDAHDTRLARDLKKWRIKQKLLNLFNK